MSDLALGVREQKKGSVLRSFHESYLWGRQGHHQEQSQEETEISMKDK